MKWKNDKRLQEVTAAFTKKFPSDKTPIKQETNNLIARGEKTWKCAVVEYSGRPGSAG